MRKKKKKESVEKVIDNCRRCGQPVHEGEIDEGDRVLCTDCQWDDADFVDSTYDPD